MPPATASVPLTKSTPETNARAREVQCVIHRLRDEPELRARLLLFATEDDAARDTVVGLLAQLRAIITRHVCRMRAEGAWPEQVLVVMKTVLREAMTAERWNEPRILEALTARIVDWSIAAYYDR